jgi:hypothetical protein
MKTVESWTWPDVRHWLQEQPALAKYAKNELKVNKKQLPCFYLASSMVVQYNLSINRDLAVQCQPICHSFNDFTQARVLFRRPSVAQQ